MGLFDSVYVPCKCGKDVEFQSKAGDSYMASYTLENAPDPIKADLFGKSSRCQYCDEPITIRGKILVWQE